LEDIGYSLSCLGIADELYGQRKQFEHAG
jgi:hypothetical protein